MILNISQKTAQQIVESVRDVCGQHINYIDMNGNIYASTDRNRIGKFHEIGKQVALTGETIEVEDDDTFFGTHAGVNIPIIYNGELIAVIGISGIPDEVRKYAYLAHKITILLLREQEFEYQNNSQKNQMNYIIRSLIDEDRAKNKHVTEYMREKSINEAASYQLVLVKLDNRYHPNNLNMIENMIFHAFQFMRSELYTFSYPNEYILIIEQQELKKSLYILEKLAEENEKILRIAVGAVHGLYEQYQSYDEARAAIESLQRGCVAYYSALGLEMVCANVDDEVKELYINKFLGDLSDKDIHLLKIYYKEEMSLVRTCEQLFMHKNTIQYQLDRIYKKCGFNPRNFKDACGFYTALVMSEERN